jgi:hypothetical protein
MSAPHDDGFSPFGSGDAPIQPRAILDLIDIADSQLARAERAFASVGIKKFALAGDKSESTAKSVELISESPR